MCHASKQKHNKKQKTISKTATDKEITRQPNRTVLLHFYSNLNGLIGTVSYRITGNFEYSTQQLLYKVDYRQEIADDIRLTK